MYLGIVLVLPVLLLLSATLMCISVLLLELLLPGTACFPSVTSYLPHPWPRSQSSNTRQNVNLIHTNSSLLYVQGRRSGRLKCMLIASANKMQRELVLHEL